MRVAIVAGEASGDQLGAGLIGALRLLRPDAAFVGIAGPAMRAAGCEAWHHSEELSVMGLTEVLRHLPRLLRIRRSLVRRLLARPPDVFVGIDSPDFNLPVAARLRAGGTPTLQYVCPSVWAWRQGRVRVLQRACDRVLCLLPFETEFLGRAGVAATFVGHPFADQIGASADCGAARRHLGIAAERVVGLLPGSRVGEVSRLGPAFLGAARLLAEGRPDTVFAAPLANPAVRGVFAQLLAKSRTPPQVRLFDGRAREVMAASDGLLVASGTATLEAMLIGRPMVVAYRFAPLTYWIGRSLRLVKVPHFSLPNLLAGEALVPELLQSAVTPERLSAALAELLPATPRRAALLARFADLGAQLRRDASATAARAVLELAIARAVPRTGGSSL